MNSLPLPGADAVRFDRAAVQLDEALGERQADAEPAFGAVLRCDSHLREHREYRSQRVGRNADAAVASR